MNRATPSLFTIIAMCGDGRKLFEAGLAMLVELGVVLIALLKKHILLLPIREWLLPREIVLIDQSFDRFIGAFSYGILQAANQLIFGNLAAELCKAADQII